MVKKLIFLATILMVVIMGTSFAYGYYDSLIENKAVGVQVGSWDMASSDEFVIGDGTQENPYQISNFYQLNRLREEQYRNSYFILISNLGPGSLGYFELASSNANNGLGWEPIGKELNNRFTGTLDGNGFVIDGLFINRPNESNVGLFGHIGISANNGESKISNLLLSNVNITGGQNTGALVGLVTGNVHTLIEKSGVIGGTVNGSGNTGGLVGSLVGFRGVNNLNFAPKISESFANVLVIARSTSTNYRNFGGLVGSISNSIVLNSFAHGNIAAQAGVANVGGLVGAVLTNRMSSVQYSYATGNVTGSTGTNLGGFIGLLENTTSTIAGNFWNTATSGRPVGQGIGSRADSGVTGLTTSQMIGSAAQNNMNAFDFVNVWQTTNEYPRLRNSNH